MDGRNNQHHKQQQHEGDEKQFYNGKSGAPSTRPRIAAPGVDAGHRLGCKQRREQVTVRVLRRRRISLVRIRRRARLIARDLVDVPQRRLATKRRVRERERSQLLLREVVENLDVSEGDRGLGGEGGAGARIAHGAETSSTPLGGFQGVQEARRRVRGGPRAAL